MFSKSLTEPAILCIQVTWKPFKRASFWKITHSQLFPTVTTGPCFIARSTRINFSTIKAPGSCSGFVEISTEFVPAFSAGIFPSDPFECQGFLHRISGQSKIFNCLCARLKLVASNYYQLVMRNFWIVWLGKKEFLLQIILNYFFLCSCIIHQISFSLPYVKPSLSWKFT